MKQLRPPTQVGSTGTLPRTANTSRNSSRSTSPCSSSVSGSSGIPRSISSSNAGSRDRGATSSRLQAPSIPSSTSSSSLRGRTDSPATPKGAKTTPSVPGSPAVNSMPRRSHLTPKSGSSTGSLNRNAGSAKAGGSSSSAVPTPTGTPQLQPKSGSINNADPPTAMMDKFKMFKDKSGEKVVGVPSVSKLSSLRPKTVVAPGQTLSRKEVEAAIESSLGQKRNGKSGSKPNSPPTPVSQSSMGSSSDGGPPRPHHPSAGSAFGFPSADSPGMPRSSRVESKSKPTHRISSPRHNARSASSHMRAPASPGGGGSACSAIPPPGKLSGLPTPSSLRRPSVDADSSTTSQQSTPHTSRRAIGIPSSSSTAGSRYGSLSRRKSSANSSASHSRERSTTSAANEDHVDLSATSPEGPVPIPPPRGTSKLSSVANVPYPAGFSGPQPQQPQEATDQAIQPVAPKSSSNRSGRQKARALYNAVKQREDSRSGSKEPQDSGVVSAASVDAESEHLVGGCEGAVVTDASISVEPPSPRKEGTPDPPPVKPMAPLNCSAPNSYLQMLGGSRRTAPKHLAFSRVGDCNNDTSDSVGTPMSEGSSQLLDISGYMSDCAASEVPGANQRWGGYQSDLSGYLSEGGYMSDSAAVATAAGLNVYAGKIQRRFREGLRAVEESLQSTQDISCSDVDIGPPEDDVSSISSGNLSDLAAELSGVDDTSVNTSTLSSDVTTRGGQSSSASSVHHHSHHPMQMRPGQGAGGLGSRAPVPPLAGSHYGNHHRQIYGVGRLGVGGGSGGMLAPRSGGGPVCYSSDVEDTSPYACHNSLRKYASDVEGDYDLDISSSCSMDLLSGKIGSDYYFSDTESLITRPPLPRPGGRKSDAGLHTDQSTMKYLRKLSAETGGPAMVLNPNCPMHSAGGGGHTMGSHYHQPQVHLQGDGGTTAVPHRRPSPNGLGLGAFQRQVLARAHAGGGGGGGSTRLDSIRSGAGQASAMDDLELHSAAAAAAHRHPPQQQPSPSLGGHLGGSGSERGGLGGSSGLLLSNVKLPYAIGVKNSYSNSSLSRADLTDDMDIKGSHLSLVSIGSCRSVNDERQTQEIRRLRVDLELAQQKVTTLSTQLTTNAHVVSAFDHNLASMTSRLQALNATTEKKENEIMELKAALENLKKQQNVMANGGLSGSASSSAVGASESGDNLDGSLRSAESLTSLNSNGSGGQDGNKRASKEAKEKKTGWLRQSFGKAFRKKSKGGHGEMDSEMYQQAVNSVMAAYGATAAEAEELLALKRELEEKDLRLTDVQLEALSSTQQLEQLRDLMEKMKSEMTTLKTDNERLQRLVRVGGDGVGVGVGGGQTVQPPVHPGVSCVGGGGVGGEVLGGEASPETSELKKKLSLDVAGNTSPGFDLLFGFPLDEGCRRIPVSVRLPPDNQHSNQHGNHHHHHNSNPTDGGGDQTGLSDTGGSSGGVTSESRIVHLGLVTVGARTKWDNLDACVRRLLREYVGKVDPLANLGLNGDSIQSYSLSDSVIRSKEYPNLPDLPPFDYLGALSPDQMHIWLHLKGTELGGGVGSGCPSSLSNLPLPTTVTAGSGSYLDTLAFDTLIPKTVLQRYICLLLEHQRIMLCGPSGTGKTFLANRLADYLVMRANRRQHEGAIATFNVDHKSSKELRTYLANLAEQIDSNRVAPDQLPTVIILDNLHHVTSLAEIFNSFLSVKHQRSPYIIGTMNQATTTTTNLQLHHNFRWVLCTNHMEPVKGFLGRFLRRKLVQCEVDAGSHHAPLQCIVEWIPLVWQHLNRFLENFSSADVTIGPRLFLACPMDTEASKVWFTDLWNYSLVPYLLEAVREGLQLYGRRGPWEDPADWLIKTWPWDSPPAMGGQDWASLLRLRPEDVGYDLQLPLAALTTAGSTGSPGNNCSSAVANSKRVIEQIMTSSSGTSCEPGDQLVNMLMRLQEAANSSS